jgi:hypothetical protein
VNSQKIQKFAGDVVYDIRSRGLLPVVILLAVGVIVVPMLIKGGGSEATVPPAPALPGTGDAALQNEPAVLTYNPSVRDYHQRLDDLEQKDPFVQQFRSGSATDAAAADTAGATTAPTAPADTGSSGTGSSGGSTGSTPTGGSTGGTTVTHTFYYRETDILIGDTSAPLKRRNRIPDLSFLPNDKTPVLIYMGATRDAKTAVFLVSDDVTVVAGQDRCSPSPEDCQALRMHENDAVTLDNAVDGKTYRLKVLDIRLVHSQKLPQR